MTEKEIQLYLKKRILYKKERSLREEECIAIATTYATTNISMTEAGYNGRTCNSDRVREAIILDLIPEELIEKVIQKAVNSSRNRKGTDNYYVEILEIRQKALPLIENKNKIERRASFYSCVLKGNRLQQDQKEEMLNKVFNLEVEIEELDEQLLKLVQR